MKEMHRSSVVFLFLNNYNKESINSVKILCNNKLVPYIRKSSGHCIFANMEKGKYVFDVSANGYYSKTYKVDIDGSNIEIVDVLNINKVNPIVRNINAITITFTGQHSKPLKDVNVLVRLDTRVPELRVVEVSLDNKSFKLNASYNKSILYNYYTLGRDFSASIKITGYDALEGSYLYSCKKDLNDVKAGDILKPIWNFKTNYLGEMLLPVIPLFMNKDEISFSILLGEKEYNLTAPNSGDQYLSIETDIDSDKT